MVDFTQLKREVGKLQKAVDSLNNISNLLKKGKVNPYVVDSEVQRLQRAVDKLAQQIDLIKEVKQAAAELMDEVNKQKQGIKYGLVNTLVKGLEDAGIKVRGNLPMLTAGPFTLNFDFGTKPKVKVYLGPEVELLGSVPIEPEKVRDFVLEQYRELFPEHFDGEGFINDLRRAYNIAIAQKGLAPESRVRITEVMVYYVMLQQGKSFLLDPKREHFKGIPRAHFACMLGMSAPYRVQGEWELRLDVASMTQTRNPLDHIWVPTGRDGGGVHFSTMRFIRRSQ